MNELMYNGANKTLYQRARELHNTATHAETIENFILKNKDDK